MLKPITVKDNKLLFQCSCGRQIRGKKPIYCESNKICGACGAKFRICKKGLMWFYQEKNNIMSTPHEGVGGGLAR